MGCTTSTVAPNKSYSTPGPSRSDQARRVQEAQPEGLVYEDAVDNSSNLFAAIKRGDIPTVQRMLGVTHNGDGDSTPSATVPTANVNSLLGMWNSTPLIVATQYGQKEIANMLLAESDLGDLNHRNDKGASVLLYACMEGLTDIVKDLLAKQVEVSLAPTSEAVYNQAADQSVKCTPYSIAVLNGHQAIVAMLVDAGMDVNLHFEFPTLKSVLKNTINAARDSVKDVPQIQHSAHVTSTHSTGSTIHVTAAAGGTSNGGAAGGVSGGGVLFVTPILLAAASGKLNVFRELLWRDANCSTTDGDGSTVLHHLGRAKLDSAAMFRELKKNNKINDALLDVRDKNGDTVLLVACEAKQVELLQLLLEEGCSTAHSNTYTGTSALHTAVKKRCIEVVHLLLEYGADPLLVDKNKVSALDLAMKLHKDSEIHKAMLTAGTAWKELRGMNSPSYGVVVGNAATSGDKGSDGEVGGSMVGTGDGAVDGEHDVSILQDIHDLPTVRVHATISTKMNNYTTIEASTIDYTTHSNSTSPVRSKDSKDSVHVYDSPEHVHIRGAESTTTTNHTNTTINTANKKVSVNDKVLEHLGRRASEFQAQLALDESIKNATSTNNNTNANNTTSINNSYNSNTTNTTTNATSTGTERRASVLTAEEEVLLVDNDGDIDLNMEDGPMLEIIGTPMSVSSPVKVPHHTPHAPAPPSGRTMFTFTDASVKDSVGSTGVGVGGLSSVKEGVSSIKESSGGNSANTSTTNHTNTITTPTGSAAVAQASTLYRTGSFKSPTLPKKDISVERGSVVRKTSTSGSFKSPYAVGSGIGGAASTPITSRKSGEMSRDNSSGNIVSPRGDVELTEHTPAKSVSSKANTSTAETFTTPQKTPVTTSNNTTTSAVNTTATTTTATNHTSLVSSTAVKPSTTTTSAIVSQSAYAPRRPSEIPTTDGARPSIRSGRYGTGKIIATGAVTATGSAAGTSGGSGKGSNGTKGSGKGVSSIPVGELVAPVPRNTPATDVTDNTNTNIDTTDATNTNTNTNTNTTVWTPSRPIVASPPAKPVSEAKSFRRGSSSTVKKTAGAK